MVRTSVETMSTNKSRYRDRSRDRDGAANYDTSVTIG